MTKRKRTVHCRYSLDFRLDKDEEECVHALLALSRAAGIHGEEYWTRPEKEKPPSQTPAPRREQGLTLLLTPEVEKQNQTLPPPSTREQEPSSISPPVLVQQDQKERLPSTPALAKQSHLLPPPPPEKDLPSLLAPSLTQQSQTSPPPPPEKDLPSLLAPSLTQQSQTPPPSEKRLTLLSSPQPPPEKELLSLLAPSLTQQCQTTLPPPPPPEKRLTMLSSLPPPPEQELPSLLAPSLTQQNHTPSPPPPEQRLTLLSSPAPPPSPPRGFKCSECGKTFSSYQALGGHKTSHWKRPAAKQAGTTTARPPAAVTQGGEAGNERPHECSVCHKSFPTGQSLGGHMRFHYKGKRHATSRSAVATPSSSSTECSTSSKGLGIDLNQPAALEVDWSKEEAGVSSRPPFAAQQLASSALWFRLRT